MPGALSRHHADAFCYAPRLGREFLVFWVVKLWTM